MGDMDALGRQLARHRLRQPAQSELAHGEAGRQRKALHARGGAGQEDRAVGFGHHALRRLLGHQEAAEGADLDRAPDVVRRQVDQRAAHPAAGVVDHDVRGAPSSVEGREQARNFLRIGGVAGMNLGAGLLRKCSELVGLAGSQ
jgi:hypothetical protein